MDRPQVVGPEAERWPRLEARRWPAAGGASVGGGPAGEAARSLVVLCHGLGESGSRWSGFVQAVAPRLPGAAFSAPAGPQPAGAVPARRWWDYHDARPGAAEAGVRAGAGALAGFVQEECARLGLPLRACALVGFSQGAMVALHAGLRLPQAPAAVLAYAGKLVVSNTGEVTARPPVLLVHGREDRNVPPQGSTDAAAVLAALGVQSSALLLDGLDHTIDARAVEIGAVFLRGHL